jgi:hypothetical protein
MGRRSHSRDAAAKAEYCIAMGCRGHLGANGQLCGAVPEAGAEKP